jgi:predicted amidophosphoribosyltransferase
MLARLLAQVFHALFPEREDEAVVAASDGDTLLALLDPELVPLGDGSGAAALLPFNDERVRAALHEAKYRGNARAFGLLAGALIEYLREVMGDSFGRAEYVLVPVPLGKERRKERGFNQVEEVLKLVAGELDLRLDPTLLERTRETASQVSLPRQKRLANMRGAFGAAHPPDPAYLYIVVDDVLTTGATLSAACSALKNAGAPNILAVALAH